jgi:predicted RNase H-like HicB family nuclease
VIYIPDGTGGYIAQAPSLPGCITKGKNLSEVMNNSRQAIYDHLATLETNGQPIPESTIIEAPKDKGVFSHNILLKEDVIRAIQDVFPNEDLQTILVVMNEYGKKPFEIDTERVQVASIRLSEGNVDKLLQIVSDAKRDYRDVISWYAIKFSSYP